LRNTTAYTWDWYHHLVGDRALLPLSIGYTRAMQSTLYHCNQNGTAKEPQVGSLQGYARWQESQWLNQGITKGGSITVPLISCLTGLEADAWQLTMSVFICKTD
jgi:hypothetical protein